jgi:hypothetical protein
VRGTHGGVVDRDLDEVAGAGIPHLPLAHVHGRVLGQLLAPGSPQLRGCDAVVAEQPADAVRNAVGGAAGVDHEHVAARAAEHEGGAQARGPSADDEGVEDGRAGG